MEIYGFCFVKLHISVLSNKNYRIVIPHAHEKHYMQATKRYLSAFSQRTTMLKQHCHPMEVFCMHALYTMQKYTCTCTNVYLYNRNYLKGIHPVPMSKS